MMSRSHDKIMSMRADKQNDVSQSEDALHLKLNYLFILHIV